jgi:hypothetical protein
MNWLNMLFASTESLYPAHKTLFEHHFVSTWNISLGFILSWVPILVNSDGGLLTMFLSDIWNPTVAPSSFSIACQVHYSDLASWIVAPPFF